MLSLRSYVCRLMVKYWIAKKLNAEKTVPEQRAAFEFIGKLSMLPFKTKIKPVDVDTVSAQWISVGNFVEDCVVLYLHGGGYNIGSPYTHRDLAARISKASGARTLLIDYRLAPEHPYPAAVDDAVTAYRWLLENGYSPQNIAVSGDSAGGGLTIATLVSLRDAGEPMPAAAVCLSAWTDLGGTGESIQSRLQSDPLLTPDWLQLLAKNYIRNNDPRTPLISPIYADLHDLPPILIQVGSDEILLSDSSRLAERALDAGVDITLDVWQGMWHNWHFFAALMPEAKQSIQQIGIYIRRHLSSLV